MKKHLKRIFIPFFTTRKTGSGIRLKSVTSNHAKTWGDTQRSYLAGGRNRVYSAILENRNLFYTFTKKISLQIQEDITRILVDKLGIASTEVTPDANFIKDLGIDSLDYAELVMEFEHTFKIRIPDDDAEQLQTINQAVNYIANKMNAKS